MKVYQEVRLTLETTRENELVAFARSFVVVYPPLIFPAAQTIISLRDTAYPLWQDRLQLLE